MNSVIKGVIFDFDLTLVDSAIAICGNLNALAREKKLRSLTLGEVRPTIGWALVEAMRFFWGDGPAETEWLPRYRKLFVERNYAGVRAFKETIPTLEYLKSSGASLAIATNRLTPSGIVRAAGLERYFPVIVGIDDHKPKPDPAIVLEAARRMHFLPSEGMYVGDNGIDMETARNAGVRAVGVTSGNHTADQLRKSGADFVIETLSELPKLWEELHGKV